jgi:nitronate monooxygenase
MMWAVPGPLHTPLCDLLGVRHPVMLAGMAAGPCTPELVAAVGAGGGLGVFGATGMTADALAADVERALALGAPRVGVNVQIAGPTPATTDPEALAARLAPVREALGLPARPAPAPGAAPAASARDLVEAGLAAGASVVTTGLGDPAEVADLARAAGAPLLAMVSSVDDARRSAAAGADALIAQGAEAGGHRSTFDVGPGGEVPLVGTVALVPQVVDATGLPTVASGGIVDGRGLVAALALGAVGVSMGTRFLLAAESAVPPAYRARLAGLADTATVVTDAVTGRPARWVRNRLVDDLRTGPGHLGWGPQRTAVGDVRAAATARGDAELMPMLAGQAAGLARDGQGAAEIVRAVVEEALAVIFALPGGAR